MIAWTEAWEELNPSVGGKDESTRGLDTILYPSNRLSGTSKYSFMLASDKLLSLDYFIDNDINVVLEYHINLVAGRTFSTGYSFFSKQVALNIASRK
ncbi:hypothetical protein YC2023_027903 [Brassica napus]